jgi:hypothetical protein
MSWVLAAGRLLWLSLQKKNPNFGGLTGNDYQPHLPNLCLDPPIAHVTGSKEPPDFDDCQASVLCFELYCILFDAADALVSERKGIAYCKWHKTTFQ